MPLRHDVMIMMKAERLIHITMEPHIPHIRKVLKSETKRRHLVNVKPGTSKQKVQVYEKKYILFIKSLSHSCTWIAWWRTQLSGIRELALCETVLKTHEEVSSEHSCKNNAVPTNIYILLHFKKSRNLYYNRIYIYILCTADISCRCKVTQTVRITVPKILYIYI
jgi:hypothetical protein